MSTLILDRPTSTRTDDRPALLEVTSTAGSYVDSDGVRRTPQRVGSYTGQASASAASYTDRDGVRRAGGQGSYTRSER